MGTQLLNHQVKQETVDFSSIPPGFESLAASRRNDNTITSTSFVINDPAPQTAKQEPVQIQDQKIRRSSRRRSEITRNRLDCSSGDESDSNPFDHIVIPIKI